MLFFFGMVFMLINIKKGVISQLKRTYPASSRQNYQDAIANSDYYVYLFNCLGYLNLKTQYSKYEKSQLYKIMIQ